MTRMSLMTARAVASLIKRSKSQVHRDVAAGRLEVAQEYPGYNGPRLFDESIVRRVYGLEQEGNDDQNN